MIGNKFTGGSSGVYQINDKTATPRFQDKVADFVAKYKLPSTIQERLLDGFEKKTYALDLSDCILSREALAALNELLKDLPWKPAVNVSENSISENDVSSSGKNANDSLITTQANRTYLNTVPSRGYHTMNFNNVRHIGRFGGDAVIEQMNKLDKKTHRDVQSVVISRKLAKAKISEVKLEARQEAFGTRLEKIAKLDLVDRFGPLAALAVAIGDLPAEYRVGAFTDLSNAIREETPENRSALFAKIAGRIASLTRKEDPNGEVRLEAFNAVFDAVQELPVELHSAPLAGLATTIASLQKNDRQSAFNAVFDAVKKLPVELRSAPLTVLTTMLTSLPNAHARGKACFDITEAAGSVWENDSLAMAMAVAWSALSDM